MSAGLHRIDFPRFGGLASHWSEKTLSHFKTTLVLPAVLLAGVAGWVLLPPFKGKVAESKPAQVAAVQGASAREKSALVPSTEAPAKSGEVSQLEGLRISSQTWRRGGLGSKALISFTLRNENDYPVKDVEIICSFSRIDGTHLTDRTRVLPETVNMKSRKTFSHVLVGYVNINANQAKCSPVAARRL